MTLPERTVPASAASRRRPGRRSFPHRAVTRGEFLPVAHHPSRGLIGGRVVPGSAAPQAFLDASRTTGWPPRSRVGVARRERAPDASSGRGFGMPQTTLPPLLPALSLLSLPPSPTRSPSSRTSRRRCQLKNAAQTAAWNRSITMTIQRCLVRRRRKPRPPPLDPPPPPSLPYRGSHPRRHRFLPHRTAPHRGSPTAASAAAGPTRGARNPSDDRSPPPPPPPSRPGPTHDAPRKR